MSEAVFSCFKALLSSVSEKIWVDRFYSGRDKEWTNLAIMRWADLAKGQVHETQPSKDGTLPIILVQFWKYQQCYRDHPGEGVSHVRSIQIRTRVGRALLFPLCPTFYPQVFTPWQANLDGFGAEAHLRLGFNMCTSSWLLNIWIVSNLCNIIQNISICVCLCVFCGGGDMCNSSVC